MMVPLLRENLQEPHEDDDEELGDAPRYVGSISYHPRHPLTPPEKIFRSPKPIKKTPSKRMYLGCLVSTHG